MSAPNEQPMKTQLATKIATAWADEMRLVAKFLWLAEHAPDARSRARAERLGAGAQAHGSRFLARLAACGGGPLLTEPDALEHDCDFSKVIEDTIHDLEWTASVYETNANLARKVMDATAAWVFELNRAENMDAASEIREWRGKTRTA